MNIVLLKHTYDKNVSPIQYTVSEKSTAMLKLTFFLTELSRFCNDFGLKDKTSKGKLTC